MECNVGTADRIVRALIGIALLILAYAATGAVPALEAPYAWEVWVTGIVGLVLIGTAATRFCLIYRLVGADTCSA